MLRTKKCFAGVKSSSSRCGGVSALIGRSFSILKPSFPSIPKGSEASAIAAGISPPGILLAKGMLDPKKAIIAASPLFFRNPRRVSGSTTRPHNCLSASFGFLRYNSWIPTVFCFLLDNLPSIGDTNKNMAIV